MWLYQAGSFLGQQKFEQKIILGKELTFDNVILQKLTQMPNIWETRGS